METQQDTTQQVLPTTPVPQQARNGLLYVCIAVMFFGTSSVFTRWSAPFNALEIAFWRLAIAAILVAIFGLITRQSLLLARRDIPRFLLYGLVTALHFFFYNASLNYTTVAHSLSITYTSPIFVALFSVLFLRESLPIRKYVGIGIAVLGIAILVGFEPQYRECSLTTTGNCMVLGDGLALLSAICFGIYSIAGRGERERHPLFRYTMNVYGMAALWLLPLELYFAFDHPYPLLAVGSILALGIFPLGLGHTLYNASVRKIHATYANLIATQEVTIGVILGIFLLGEIPSLAAIIGGVVTLAGIISVLI
ncbi:MAG TPA: EamA family transporter [Ktedonobacteraceae bacterium]|jgi:drug/metabolite transporter (DMT)-like permease|nr:EamA family transporter [Ktedonobacteraceae bacterium]